MILRRREAVTDGLILGALTLRVGLGRVGYGVGLNEYRDRSARCRRSSLPSPNDSTGGQPVQPDRYHEQEFNRVIAYYRSIYTPSFPHMAAGSSSMRSGQSTVNAKHRAVAARGP